MQTARRLVCDSERGFTLVEIAIVMLIVGLLIAAGLGVTVNVVDNAKARTTKQNMESVRLALQSFIARSGRLPCPAVEDLVPSNPLYGIEAGTPGTCTGTVDLPEAGGPPIPVLAVRGVVPWRTLGLILENAGDGWSRQLTYMVARAATNGNFETISGMRGTIYVHSAVPVLPGLPGPPANGNQINACSSTANDNACNKAAAAVLLSHGKNGAGGYTTAGIRVPPPTDINEVENTNNDRSVVSAEPSTSFDDVVLPITPDEFLAPLAAQGAIRSERSVLQERARQVVIQLLGEVAATRETTGSGIGSCSGNACRYRLPVPVGLPNFAFETGRFNTFCDPPYNTILVATGYVSNVTGTAAQILDPWGNVFKYATAKEYITGTDACKTPIAIVSFGFDGALGGGDDVVYYSPMADWKEILGKIGW